MKILGLSIVYIAVLCNSAMPAEKNDIRNFLGNYFLSTNWSYQRFAVVNFTSGVSAYIYFAMLFMQLQG
jgi:hypothetical protein